MSSANQNTLKGRVLAAGIWSFSGYGVSLAIRLVSNLIMTRLLAPEMFGVMAIASTVIVGLSMFSDLGLRQNIVQSRRGHEPVYLNTVWAIQIIRGIAIFSISLLVCATLMEASRVGL